MDQPQQDKETTKVLNEGDRIARFVQSEDYQLIKGKLMGLLAAADSISTIASEDLEKDTTMRTIQIRAGAIALVKEWIGQVEGIANQAIHTAVAMTEQPKDDIIIRS
jgi:hypothetical protein